MKKVQYNKYDLIFTEGMPGDCAYMIDKGRIAIISGKDIHDKHKVLAILHKDAIFGEMALIDEEVRSATAFALEDCTLSIITPKTLHYLIEKEALSLTPLLEILAQRLRQSTKLLRDEIKANNQTRAAIPTGRD